MIISNGTEVFRSSILFLFRKKQTLKITIVGYDVNEREEIPAFNVYKLNEYTLHEVTVFCCEKTLSPEWFEEEKNKIKVYITRGYSFFVVRTHYLQSCLRKKKTPTKLV